MELLVATLAYMRRENEIDALTKIHQLADTLKGVRGLINMQAYRNRGQENCYLFLTTWEHEEAWRKDNEQHNPGKLLQETASGLLNTPPQQWLMLYLWGYRRPAAQISVITMQIVNIPSGQIKEAQRRWIGSLKQQAVEPLLAFASLSKGVNEQRLPPMPPMPPERIKHNTPIEEACQKGTSFLYLAGWPGEEIQAEFYDNQEYQQINDYLGSIGRTQIYSLALL